MLWSFAGLAAVFVVWSLSARCLQRLGITPALALVAAGVLVGIVTRDALADNIAAHSVEPVIETVLAMVLFSHATSVRGGFLGGQARLVLRLLFVALPIALVLAVVLGLALLPGLPWPILLVLACVVVPIDFAPVASFLHDERLPVRVRRLFNVEEGYSDGVIAPIFVFALAVAVDEVGAADGLAHALRDGLPHLIVAIALGVVLGAGVAWVANAADRRAATTDQSRRMLTVGVPVLTYAVTVGLHGNGFVAAFTCGIAFNAVRRYVDAERELDLVEDVVFILGDIVWFVFGTVAWYVLQDGVPMVHVVFGLLVLTVVRALPVGLALLRSPLTRSDRTLLAALAPRGTASIVLALLAYAVLPDEAGETLLEVAIVVVLGSVVMHGLVGHLLAGRGTVDGETPARQ